MDRREHLGAGPEHWNTVHGKRRPEELTWFEATPRRSLELIERSGGTTVSRVLDVGGGSSRLCDALIEAGFLGVTVVDISAAALAHVRARLAGAVGRVTLVEADAGAHRGDRPFDVWHDRAMFHFLLEDSERERYVAAMKANLAPRGHAVIATFGLRGPEMCSGLPVCRYGPGSLGAALGDWLEPLAFEDEMHATPAGGAQHFVYGLFRRND